MRHEDAPPGFWQWPEADAIVVNGVEFDSTVPTRFFQSVDKYPSEWGRLAWRVQLNATVGGRAASPVFRTFYMGVEWNLNHSGKRWFLTAWLRWEGPGPPYPQIVPEASVEDDTALFRIAWMPKPQALGAPGSWSEPDLQRPIYLRSRIDARDRRRISESLRSQAEPKTQQQSAVIVVDDILQGPG